MKPLTSLRHLLWKDWLTRLGGRLTDQYGAFRLQSESRAGNVLACIASTNDGWDHVSVSCELRLPTWTEMEQVKRTFFHENETAMQLHVPPRDHVNIHPNCLHLWRPQFAMIPRPEAWMVA